MKTILFLLVVVIAVGCTTAPVEQQAQQLTLSELNSVPGYAWFPVESNLYSPSGEMVDSLNARFNSTTDRFIVFVKPSCSCRGTQKLFPQVVKTITEANVPASNIEIWSMRSESDTHPYMDNMKINELPIVFVTRNNAVLSQIRDADYNTTNADTLVANSLLP